MGKSQGAGRKVGRQGQMFMMKCVRSFLIRKHVKDVRKNVRIY